MVSRRYPKFEGQWRKMMYSFYEYMPMRKKDATQAEWNIRRLIWDFKDGKNYLQVAYIIAKKILQLYGSKASNIVFACIPASSEQKNEKRYKDFSDLVCFLTGAQNAYNHIEVKGERLAIHESKEGKHISSVEVINFDKDFFKGKDVLVFDDILTKGFSYARFANQIETFGAKVLGGLFLGKTAIV